MDYTESNRLIHAVFHHLFAQDQEVRVEFGPGWVRLAFKLCEELDALWDSSPSPNFSIVTMREKFGVLRVAYKVPSGNPLMTSLYLLTERYIRDSATTCELCGKAGTLIEQPWQRVRCQSCKAQSIGGESDHAD
ncbi:hypothetical protein [Achromobacter marplatensis]|uniref:hypothetical protein n=1 Tax=Achromobacter marplatensis TaxID=470868 RepID=UPI0028E9C62D|nr:hypothetical protein [Achromobacter marplatensis]